MPTVTSSSWLLPLFGLLLAGATCGDPPAQRRLLEAVPPPAAGRPLFEEDAPVARASPAEPGTGDVELGRLVLAGVNARYHHFAPGETLDAWCDVTKGDRVVGKLHIQFFTPGKLAIRFHPNSDGTVEDRVVEDIVRAALDGSLLHRELSGGPMAARRELDGSSLAVGGEAVDVPPGSVILTPLGTGPYVRRHLYVVSSDHRLLHEVLENEDGGPGGRGEVRSLVTRTVGDKSFVEALRWRRFEGGRSRTVDIQYTYFRKEGTPFFRHLDMVAAGDAGAGGAPEAGTQKWRVTVSDLTVGNRERGP